MKPSAVLVCALAGFAGTARATNVEFRIVERRGQTAWDGVSNSVPLNDNILNLAVQARVVGGAADESLGDFRFDILTNDVESAGTLAKCRISNADGTYVTDSTAFNNNPTVGRGGLAAIYTYLVGINPNFNGLINTSGGTFTQNPAINDLGLVYATPKGNSILLLTDLDGDGNPDTYPGSGTTAPIDPTIANTYLGANGNFVDVYHFNYAMTAATNPLLSFSLNVSLAQTFGAFGFVNLVWCPGNPVNAMNIVTSNYDFRVTPAPASVAILGLASLAAARRRREGQDSPPRTPRALRRAGGSIMLP